MAQTIEMTFACACISHVFFVDSGCLQNEDTVLLDEYDSVERVDCDELPGTPDGQGLLAVNFRSGESARTALSWGPGVTITGGKELG